MDNTCPQTAGQFVGPGIENPRSGGCRQQGTEPLTNTLPAAERRAQRVALACKIYQSRLDRIRFFQTSIFGDAGWDILLAIYVFASAGRTLTAGQLCDATCEASTTTALRQQRRLVDLGLVRRIEPADDRRRLLVELTEEGTSQFEDYLDHLLDTVFRVPALANS